MKNTIKNTLLKLVRISNYLDELGLYKQADSLDKIIKLVGTKEPRIAKIPPDYFNECTSITDLEKKVKELDGDFIQISSGELQSKEEVLQNIRNVIWGDFSENYLTRAGNLRWVVLLIKAEIIRSQILFRARSDFNSESELDKRAKEELRKIREKLPQEFQNKMSKFY